ncbi:DUF2249 domain-containing protein [Segetibacter koreensis]|uniref:DUF2249 domain-containing protein n=1 Tax=Segetibacter koreensis TaxID=398037 RepID=UPI000368937D|nr:DUF2249 domain-containing protein [Segetibacter koreensis]
MLINSQTKISALLKYHPDALEAIVALSPDFKKLRNPVLRKLMAGRTSIAMASKIGGCTPFDFFEKLQPYGFEMEISKKVEEEILTDQKLTPPFLQNAKAENIVSLDVRSILASGNDPLKLIQQTVKGLQQDQVLKIINTFEPTPLIQLLKKQGFQWHVDVVEKDLVETYFYKKTATPNIQAESPANEINNWDQLLKRYEEKLQAIDVRNLEMPLPMTTILEALEKLPVENALYVHHKRVPVFLLAELKDRQFDYRIKEVSDGDVFLLIFKS